MNIFLMWVVILLFLIYILNRKWHSINNSDILVKTPEQKLARYNKKFGSEHGWVEKYLAHENAHVNIAEVTEHEVVGYATVFIKDNTGELVAIQPLNFTKPQLEWGPEEMIRKNIETAEAPEKYGDKLSDGDKSDLTLAKQRLEKIEENKKRLVELKKELGIE